MRAADAQAWGRIIELLRPWKKSPELAIAEYIAILESLGGACTPADAVAFWRARHPVGLSGRNIPELVEAFVAAKKSDGLSVRHLKDLQGRLGAFAKKFTGPASALAPPEVDNWLRTGQWGLRSRNNYRCALLTFVRWCKARHHLPVDWELSSARAKLPPTDPKLFEPGELARLLEACPDRLLPFLAISAFAGLRHAELNGPKGRLNWSAIDWEAKTIYVGANLAKTSAHRIVPMTPNLEAWLKPFAKIDGPICTIANTSKAINHLAKAVGIIWRRNALRKSFISYRLAITQNIAQVAEEAGNSPAKILSNYRRPIQRSQAERWFAISPAPLQNVHQLKLL